MKTVTKKPVKSAEDVRVRCFDQVAEARDIAHGLADILCTASGQEEFSSEAYYVLYVAANKLAEDLDVVEAALKRE